LTAMTGLVDFLLFLVFANDGGARYRDHFFAPLDWAYDYLLAPTPVVVRPFDLAMLVILSVALAGRRGFQATVAPMKNTLLLALATTAVWSLLGLSRGGDFRHASWQTYLIFSTLLATFAVAATHRTVNSFRALAKWLVAAALYHGLMCWISYFTWGRADVGGAGEFLTTHHDTITWVVAILILVVQVTEKPTALIISRNLTAILFLVGAIEFNSRRIAWLSLAFGLAVMYFLFPKGTALQRVVRRAYWVALPMILLYVAVGWGRQNRIFLPLKALSSVTTQEDTSTIARNVENLNLIATANYNSPLTGAGWGRPYAAMNTKYDISRTFELWQYVPHNSILGLLAFTGILGFAGFWLALPTAVFLNARVARLSPDKRVRSAATIAAAQLIVSANQLYGDMGIFSLQAMYVIAVSYAIALRLPVLAGVWAGSRPAQRPSGPC
jgi:O-antigen ligase/polysaccharide polymerase Wzy-like membrane protein